MEFRRDILQNEHEGLDQAALASDTDDGGGDSSDEPFDYGYMYSDGGPVSAPDEEGLEEALVHTAVPTARRPNTNVICGGTRDSVRRLLGRYYHTRRPYAGPDMLAVQIEERRAELAFLRTVRPQGPTQPPASATHSRDDSANRRRRVGQSGATRSGPSPNGGHRHGRGCRV